jgi:hypothetical protein
MVKIKKNLKEAQDGKKCYADKRKKNREFKVGEYAFMKLKLKKISFKLRSCTKLASRFCGPFEVLDRIRLVAYMLALDTSMNMHNAFHISLLKKYVHDPNHVIYWNLIHVEPEGDLWV